jgi:hypothetical protein
MTPLLIPPTTSVYMVSGYTRIRVMLADNRPLPHCDNRYDFNGLASMLPKGAVLYGFRITRITSGASATQLPPLPN